MATTLVVCLTLVYVVGRVCDTMDQGNSKAVESRHIQLTSQHEAILTQLDGIRQTADDTHRMTSYLYNMARNANPDVQVQR